MLLLLTLACTAPTTDAPLGTDTGEEPLPPPTGTFPAFYGEVPKNLLMVSIDTFRRDLLSRYGGEGHAPFLDSLVESGLALDDHRTCSNWTFPSVMCVIHGATNIEAGFVPDLRSPGQAMMPDEMPTLAGTLADAGYRTMLVTSNSWFSADHNTDVGYDYSIRPDDRRTQSVFGQGLEYLQYARDDGVDRWYLHLHVKEPHPAYDPPDQYLAGLEDLDPIDYDFSDSDEQYDMHDEWPEMTDAERELVLQHLLIRYHGEVQWLDDQLTDQFIQLEQAGMLDDTLVVFWVDHGEQFWEHGEQTHAYGLTYEENDGVAFMWAKNIVPASWDGATSHIDLAPTVLSLLEVDAPATMSGLPIGTAPDDRPLHQTALARLGTVQSVVQDGWKLVYRWETGERWLYDTVNDPTDANDLYSPVDPHAIGLEALLQEKTLELQPLTNGYTPN